MKKILLFFAFFICLNVFQTKAQTYHKFLNNSSWCESQNDGFGQPIYYFLYNQANDTVINSLTYAKILVTGGGATFYVREDTIAKKVYVFNQGDLAEAILYDFSLHVGDTLFAKWVGSGDGIKTKLILRTIDTVTTLVGARQRFSFTDSSGLNGYSTIESVGCPLDPFLNDYPGGDPVCFLVCSYQNNIQVYDGATGYTCYSYNNTPPARCNPNFSYTYGLNGQVMFKDSTSGYSSYHWSFGYGADTTVINSPLLTMTFPCNATFSVSCSITSTSGNINCTSYPAFVTVTNAVNGLNASYTYTVQPNGQINFTNTSVGMVGSSTTYYEWYVYDSTNTLVASSSAASPNFTLPVNQNYTVTLYDNSYPCHSVFTETISNTFVTTGINKLKNNSGLILYPNPNNGNFIIETIETENQIIKIFDVTGKVMFSQHINAKADIDVSNLMDGMYFIEMKTQENVFTQKVIIQH